MHNLSKQCGPDGEPQGALGRAREFQEAPGESFYTLGSLSTPPISIIDNKYAPADYGGAVVWTAYIFVAGLSKDVVKYVAIFIAGLSKM